MRPLLFALILSAARLAHADSAACPEGPLAWGPIQLGLGDADLGVIRRACPRTDGFLGLRAAATVATPDFYGNVGAGVDVSASRVFGDENESEIFATVTPLQIRYLVNATLAGTRATFGAASVGATRVLSRSEGHLLSAFGRLHLPTSFEYQLAWPTGVEAGLTGGWVSGILSAHGGLSVQEVTVFGRAGAPSSLGATGLAGGALTPTDWFSVVVDLHARATTAQALQFAGVSGALRLRLGRAAIELDLLYPLAGTVLANATTVSEARTVAAFALRGGTTF